MHEPDISKRNRKPVGNPAVLSMVGPPLPPSASSNYLTEGFSLGSAIVDARAGNYELARQGTSDFFSNLATEVERGSIFSAPQESQLRSLLQERDDVITTLARSDPYSADRLTKLYNQYREATTNVAAR